LKYATHERATRITCYNEINNALVKISIEDNGIGIDMRYAKDKIFNLYQRFHTEVTGKGFGLFLTRTQVESMGGTISVKSTPNMGTTFMLEFPVSKDVVAEG
jgi:signal transduction histidine kinase